MALASPRLPTLLDLPRVADTLDVSVKTVRRWIERDELRVHRVGRQLRVSEEDSPPSSPSVVAESDGGQ